MAAILAVVIGLVLVGCGEKSSGSAEIRFWSPAVDADGVVAPNVQCGLGTLWLPLKWGSIPEGTKDLVIYFGRFVQPDPKQPSKLEIPFGSAFPEVDLGVHGVEANAYPAGSSPHYLTLTNCVPSRSGQQYVAALFALNEPSLLPEPLSLDFAKRITEEALGVEDPVTVSPSAEELLDSTLASDSFTAIYGKPD